MHDSVRAVLRDPVFRQSLRRSLGDRLLLWLAEWFERFLRVMRGLPSTRSIVLGIIALVVLFVVVRVVIAARARDERAEGGARGRGARSGEDPWVAAEQLVAQGRFEDAAHALYRGVILTLAREERLRLDPSKTSGDYARELRRKGASSLAAFRDFTRRFDVAVYGHGGCDAAALAELRALSMAFRPRARAA